MAGIGHNSNDTITFRKFHAKQKEIVSGLTGRDILRCGRRFGKTTLLEDLMGNRACRGKRVGWFAPNYKLILPTYKRILRTVRPLVVAASKVDMIIELEGGGCVEFWTTADEDAGRSRAYDDVAIDEASLHARGLKDVWEKSIAPTLLDRRGRAIMAGTPKGIDPDNFFYEVCANAINCPTRNPDLKLEFKEFHMPTWENPTLDPVGVSNLIHEYPPLVYQQEFKADFVDWSGAAFFSLPSLLDDQGQPVEFPERCDEVFAVMDTAVKTGKENDGTAVVYCARSRVGHRLIILDWDYHQIEGASLETWLPSVFAKLEEYARQTQARNGAIGCWIEDKSSGSILLQQARNRGWRAHDIDSVLTSLGKEERAISVSGYVYQGLVKLSRQAHDKTAIYKQQSRNHLITQVCGFRIGVKDPKAQDDLLDAFCYSIAISLGDSYGL